MTPTRLVLFQRVLTRAVWHAGSAVRLVVKASAIVLEESAGSADLQERAELRLLGSRLSAAAGQFEAAIVAYLMGSIFVAREERHG